MGLKLKGFVKKYPLFFLHLRTMFPKYLFTGLLCLLLSGCFEIIEEVSYKGKDNGTFSLTANCSKSKTRLKTLIKLDTFMGVKIPRNYEIDGYIYNATQAIRTTPGTSNVNSNMDMENFILTLTFDFDKTETLNKALNNAANTINRHKDLAYMNVFSFDNTTFTRNQIPAKGTANTDTVRTAALKLISDASITSIYRFTTEVKTTSNKKALISKNKKAVMLKQNVADIVIKPELFTNSITF